MPQQIGVMAEGTVRTKKPATVDEMNLKSVRRLDPCAVTIIDKTAHAALYEFDREKFEWVKTAIEGPLFLYERADAPLHSLMIANRQSLKDLIEPILPPVLFFLETPYVFMNKLAERQIIGFWFFDEEDCKRFYEVLLRLAPQTTTHPSMAATNPEALVNGYRVNTNQSAGKPQFSIGTGPATNKNDQKSSIFDADSADRKHSQPSVAASPTASRSSHSSTTGNDPPVAAAAAEKARQYGNSSTSPSNKNAEPSNDICSAANKGDLHSSGNGMPALLRQILHKHSVSTLPALPTQGVLSADQIEEQYLTGDDEKKNAAAAPSGKAGSGNEKQKIATCESSSVSKANESGGSLPMNSVACRTQNQTSPCSLDAENSQQQQPRNSAVRDCASENDAASVASLTKQQMLMAFKQMLKDDGFVGQLHRAYLDVMNERLGLND